MFRKFLFMLPLTLLPLRILLRVSCGPDRWPECPYDTYCVCVCDKSLQLCPALCDPMDCSPPGSSVHGILQARISGLPCPPPGIFLTQGSSPCFLCLLHWQVGSLPPTLPGKPTIHTRLLPIPSDKLSVDLFSDLTPV